jgi:hypothetical protein
MWLSVCVERNVMFCFPCFLFGGDTPWTKPGVTDLKHLGVKLKKYEDCVKHLKNVIDLAVLGTVNTASQLREAYR